MNRKQLNNIIHSIKNVRNNATDEQALEAIYLYPEWNIDKQYNLNERILYQNILYKCIIAHTSQASWTPDVSPSLWTKVLAGQEGTGLGEWTQPDSTNPYMKGDKVIHNNEIYESNIDNNVWEPGIYGWTKL